MSNNSPIVSVIIPTYNSEKYISDTIKSVVLQTYIHIEIIIVDDCSGDDTVRIVKECMINDERLRLIVLDDNTGGPARPRNIGIEASLGEYISFIDSDDLWLPQKLEKQINAMERRGCNLCCTGVSYIDKDGNSVVNYSLSGQIRDKLLSKKYKHLIVSNTITTSSVLIRKSFLADLRFDEDEFLVAVEDYYLWLTLFKGNSDFCCYINEGLVRYRLHGSNISSDYKRQQIRSLYCLAKHILNTKGYDSYLLLLFSIFGFSVKHIIRSVSSVKLRTFFGRVIPPKTNRRQK